MTFSARRVLIVLASSPESRLTRNGDTMPTLDDTTTTEAAEAKALAAAIRSEVVETELETPTKWPEMWWVANIADISRDNDDAKEWLKTLAGNVVERYAESPESLAPNEWDSLRDELAHSAAYAALVWNGDVATAWAGLRGWAYSETVEEIGGYVEDADTLDRCRVELYAIALAFLDTWRAQAAETVPEGARHWPTDDCDGRPMLGVKIIDGRPAVDREGVKCSECGIKMCACEVSYGHECEL